ncbi:hypothetical protein SGQ83_01290 [Flavobacterium sp. Fl-318]|uniref:Uncharacterized protein n=1 Tax=Flavobacterium cupriresistens TaxID=2893885 RepID=A0ABU4R5W3_9FLAO|nr:MULTISPECIES: hypothetical protein [unclassified Flavobacterium]MDX6187969.1 hypothetical protein [Flavobacterium sp. Fl-318]UFH42111.1 hypothetical protein LNP23_20160 [Flavobacterium sp. F-323]
MEQLTTYTVKSKVNGFIWLFKYYLKGDLKSFEVLDGQLSQKQIVWLFASSNFPATENIMKKIWMSKSLKDNFEISVSMPEINFENLWSLYGHKVSKFDSEKAFNKLKEADRIKCFLAVPSYQKYLIKSRIAIAHLSTFINRQYYNDDWSKA